ncbi:NUMOD1 domain-containing DNA-binding protein [Clostridium beijerinckii]|uniref:NUMOD1 domain-containing DNA-binding protein n=1 Tax=Clostridium beijerinckii TaxID=1520 RepID=UPI0015715C39|nr:NUMOD1 domain-containing DNA-binding protein [Clostridium beijerinckii]NRU52579.1 hypothetical protein [Clostridium beijerinckii]NYC69244.1 hypothetical protein [Clostridium beijerinckii]NYC91780.1 hypothetical protein [Clostridium beijerinckii]
MKIGNIKVYGIIYKITNKINNNIYIGQTTKKNGFNSRYCCKGTEIERVYKYHKKLKESNNKSFNSHLYNSILKYGFESFEIVKIFDIAFSQDELNIKEKCWINYYDSYKNGYNQTIGGEGTFGHKALKGKENPTSRSVIQLDLSGNYIKTWDYMTQAINELNVDKASMIKSCKNKHYSASGFLWVYEDEYDINKTYKHIPKRKNSKEVYKLDEDYNIIEKYISSKEASRILKINHVSISRVCSGMRKTYLGYIWMNVEDYNKKFIKTSEIN